MYIYWFFHVFQFLFLSHFSDILFLEEKNLDSIFKKKILHLLLLLLGVFFCFFSPFNFSIFFLHSIVLDKYYFKVSCIIKILNLNSFSVFFPFFSSLNSSIFLDPIFDPIFQKILLGKMKFLSVSFLLAGFFLEATLDNEFPSHYFQYWNLLFAFINFGKFLSISPCRLEPDNEIHFNLMPYPAAVKKKKTFLYENVM